MRWFEIEPCYVFHPLNAYDDGDRVVLDVVVYPRMFDRRPARRGAARARPLDDRPGGGHGDEERLDDRPQEFPRVDERGVGRPYRYGYAVVTGELTERFAAGHVDLGDLDDEAFGNALLKHDLRTGAVQARTLHRDAYAGEPVFVPAEGADAEDDGYVLAFVNDPERGAADLLILSAQDFTGDPVAVAHLPARIPLGFHGSWIPDP